jgi:23S rRNA (uracil1939-C5)-methyltransferase
MGAIARAWAVERLGDVAGKVVWDLYGGVGDTARLLAARGASVVSVDADERAVAWARRGDAAPAIRFVAGRAEDVIGSLPDPDAVVLNPPRGGLHWDVTLRLTGVPVGRVAYVSCDAATLARDLSRLGATYQIGALRAFDLFPQTAHVETVAVLEGV